MVIFSREPHADDDDELVDSDDKSPSSNNHTILSQ